MQGRDVDPAVTRLIEAEARPVTIPDEPSLLREPARALVAVGSVIAIVSSPLPWAARTQIAGDVSKTGWQGLADGFLIAVVAIVLCVVTFNRSAVASNARIIRRLPAILGVTAVLLWLSGVRTMDGAITTWRLQGYDGVYTPRLFVCLVGVVLLAAGGIWLGTRREPKRAIPEKQPDRPVELVKVSGKVRPPGDRPT